MYVLHLLLTSGLVPIYDCCDVQDKFDHILANLKDIPRYNKDLPFGSCIVVGYTANTFAKKDVDKPSVAFIAVFKIVGTALIPLLFWAVVAAKLQTIVSHSFL